MPNHWLRSILPILFVVSMLILPFIFSFTQHHHSNQEKEFSNHHDIKQEEQIKETPSNNPKDDEQNKQKKDKQDDNEMNWGVDSASYTDQDMLACVVENFGPPKIWGRYLGTKENVSIGLDQAEIKLLQENNIKILVIYNHFTDATGYDNGRNEAKKAIELANELGVPEGVALFADIEPAYPVNQDFIIGWMDELLDSPYQPGVYGVFSEEQALFSAFAEASQANAKVNENVLVWSAFPQEGITTQKEAPEFAASGTEGSRLVGWQYGIEAESCNIDTNLFKGSILEYLW